MLSKGKQTLHATSVSINGGAVVILGPSGSGKSALGLQLMAHGAFLIADDATIISRSGDQVLATCPVEILGRIEARGIGILRAEPAAAAPIKLVIDLGQIEMDRLPPFRTTHLLDVRLPVLYKVESSHFPAAILQYMRVGRAD